MYYVEMLRAWRVLRVFLIILGALFITTVVSRAFGHGSMNVNDYVVPQDAQHLKHSVRSDGTNITTFDGTRGDHVVLQVAPSGVQTVTMTERHHGKLTTTTAHHDNAIPLRTLFFIAAFFVAIFGSVLGLSLSRENNGHLELAWTKPLRREGYAATIIAVDTCAMLALMAITIGIIVVTLAMFGLSGQVVTDQGTVAAILFSVLMALSVYSIAMAATASLRRSGAIALAILWPIGLILPELNTVKWLNIDAFARVVDTLNPHAYFHAAYGLAGTADTRFMTLVPSGVGYSIAAVAMLTLATLLAAMVQWRRLEA